eukprot:4867183-Amphidinium_carterae.1
MLGLYMIASLVGWHWPPQLPVLAIELTKHRHTHALLREPHRQSGDIMHCKVWELWMRQLAEPCST